MKKDPFNLFRKITFEQMKYELIIDYETIPEVALKNRDNNLNLI